MGPRVLHLASFLVLGLVACGGSSSSDDSASVVRGPFAIYDGTSDEGGNAARLEGTLVLENGCLYVHSTDYGRLLPVFARDARWDEAARAITLGGNSVRVGQAIACGGNEIEGPPDIISAAPSTCDASGKVWIAHALSRL